MIWVVGASYDGDYRICIEFNDGRKGIVDLQETVFNDSRPIFFPLREKEIFRRFRVEMDTVVWDNGLDLAPEFLYNLAAMPEGQRRSA
jgi:uncharacterized protein DUF2442